MAQNDNIGRLYGLLQKSGYSDIGTEDQFRAYVSDKNNARKLHGILQNEGYDDIGDENAFLGYLGVAQQNAVKPTAQPTQQQNVQQPTQKTQMPAGFGQLDINAVNPIGGDLGWYAPKKEETPIERAVKGQFTPEETQRAQKRQRQKLDEAIYEQETGNRMRQPVNTASWEAPTLARDENGNMQRDENGNPLLGMTTDQDVVKEHQDIVANQEEWDSLSDREKRERENNVMLQVEQDNYEEPGFLGVTANKLGAGFIKAGLGLLNGMQALASGMIVEDASSPTGYSKTAEYNPADDSNAINRGLTTANEYAERMSRRGEPRKGEGFVDMLMDGDIGGFLLKGWGTGLESAPMTLSAYNPYTMVLNAVSMAGNNFREQTLENPDIPTWKRASMAVGSAAIEQAVEKFADPVFKYIGGGKILKKASKEASEEITRKITEEAEKTIAKRIIDVLKDAAGEGLEEVVTNFGNDALGEALDLLSGDKDYGIRAQWEELKRNNPNASLSDFAYQKAKENLDSFFGGALAGAYMSGGAQVTVTGLQYAVGKTVSGQQIINNPKEQVHPVTLDVAQSFDEGYTLESDEERGSASARYYELDERLGVLVGEGVMQRIDRNPTEALANIDQFGLDEEGQKLLNDYIAAKATYDGMVERIQDDQRRSRVNSYNVRGNVVEELDSEGNVVGTHEYDNADDLKLGLFELQQERANNDMLADIKLMRAKRDGRLEQILNDYCTMMDISMEEFEAILNKNPMERTEAEQQMVQPFSQTLHETLYDNSTLHEEQNAEDGSDVADSMSIDLNEPDASQAEEITSAWNAAKTALEELFDRKEDLAQEVMDREKQGMPHQGIISSLDSFSPQDVQVVIDYYNAQAKFEGFINRMSQNIDEEAANSRERHSFKGTVNGQADLSNVYTISDGVNEYFLVSGNVQTDADGKITGSDSGLVIGMDADGSFVQLSDTSGYSVMPSVQTLDQFEEQERIRLQEQVSSVIDPNGALLGETGNDGFNGSDGTNGSANTVGSEVAAEWLLSSGQNAISSTDYLLKALSGVFGKATSDIEAIRQKYAQQIASDPSLSEIKDFVNSGMYNQIVSEINDAINDAYSNNAEVQDIFDAIMQHPTGLPARLGQEIQKRLDNISSSESTQLPLTEEQATELMDAMESTATPIPELPLTPENWEAEFGEDGKVETPIGEVKMGENQIAKLFTNKRASEFGMIKPTLTNPQVVIEVPSNPVDHDVERNTSYLFIRAFVGKDGKKTYFFKSVTVSIDGMEVSVSSHYDRKKRVKEALEKGKLLYRFDGVAQTEQQPADVSVTTLPVTEQGGLSAGKDTENIDNVQENQQKISEVTDKDGVKRYENGVPVDVAIEDILNDRLDVNETIELAIGEAQQALDKIKTPKTRAEQVKNAQKRTELQNTIDYYTRMRDRFNGSNGLDVGNREETINNSVEQVESGGNSVPSQASQTVEEKKLERIKELKAELGELFDDDFTKANDVYELVSMWVGRKRNLAWDDVNGKRGLQKELGWTRKIGGDTKYIETLLAKNGEGMGVDEFAHMVWESPENSVNGEKRWADKEIKDALLELLQSAGSKSDVVDYAVNTRERQARTALEAERQRAEEEAMQESEVDTITDEEIANMNANLPFGMPTDEDVSDSQISQLANEIEALSQQEGMPEIRLLDTDRMTDGDWIDFASQLYDGAFLSQEDIDALRGIVLENGIVYNDNTGEIVVFSGSQTAEDVRNKINDLYEEITKFDTVQEEGRDNGRDSVVAGVEQETTQGEGTTAPAAERTDEATGEGRTGEGSVDPLGAIERNAALFREEQADNDTAGEPVYTDYKTEDGYTVRYSHDGELPELAEGDFCLIEREFRENGYFGFSGGHVESADDVAYIFRNLEDSSIEHSFVVLVKDGEPRIIHLGMGGFSTTPVNMAAVRAAYDAFGADEIYFVHNHPSGSLKASRQDQGILEGIVGMFEGEDVEVQPGIIMNLKSGKYGVFGDEWSDNPDRIEDRPDEITSEEKELVVHEFDKQVFNQGYDVTNLGKIVSSQSIAAFLTSHRLGAREKLSILILNQQNEIVGNMALPYNGLNGNLKEIGKTIASVALRYGGVRVVPYGNFDLNGSAIRFLDKYVGKASGNSIHLTDAVSVENGYYKSAYDYGAMEPGSDLDSGYSEDLYAKDVNIVSAETEHGFKNFADAKKWAKDNIVRVYSNEETGGKGDINISGKAVEKFLSNDSVRKSENKDVHLSTLKVLPDIIREGVLAESHPDYKKVDGKRSKENGVNPGVTIHRVYGAVEIGDKTYRVKVTLKEDRTQAVKTRAYSYEATKIELLDGQSAAPVGTPRNSSNSISVANLLKGVEKSYGNGEKIIDSSQITDVDSVYSEELTTTETPKESPYKQRIKDHINNVTEKLGSNNITNVIESIDDISDPERRAYIEQAHKEGRKVYGWFENGEVFLYLPDIDSEYKAEQTIWHETVAHVGLRDLIGAENYGKLLNRLWIEHKDKEMGEWVTQRMQTNGWSLHKAIDEWLAREAEKVVTERQGRRTLWQKLAGWIGDMLRELGYRTNPTLTDVRYLFWLSENQLKDGDPMSKIKQAAFLHRMERENDGINGFNGLNRANELDAGYSEDIDNPLEQSAKDVYHDRLNRVETVFTEAYQDAMISLKTAQNAIVGDQNIPDSQNAYMAENLMHGKNKNEQDLFNRMFRDPIINTINKIMNITGMNWGDVDRYVYTKHGLERNRELYVRDWLEKERAKEGADLDLLNDIENRWLDAKSAFDKMLLHDYLESLDNFIRNNIDKEYNPSEHDYSGFRAMFGNEDGVYDETYIIADLMNTEDQMEADNVNELWERINAATKYGLERYREAGMRSDEQIDRIEQMFHWYVPLRGFKEDMGEDMYQYFSSKGNQKSYIGGLLKHAKGRGSEANYPISTIFAMSYKAISDCNQNLVNQKLYRLCQAHENDLIVLSDSWAVLNERTGEWEEAYPKLTDDMNEEDIRQATLAFEQEMKDLVNDGKAKKLNGKQQFDYVPMDKKKKSEHVVEVRINGQQKRMTVVGNPRMAQALNGQLRFERGKNVFSKWNASIKNKMASLFTSYSPTFALRNMFRDWTHFRTMLSVREGERYAKAANKYYRQSLFKMVGMFKKYRNGTLDMSNDMERDFKDFMDNGGITGFTQMSKVDDIQKDMEKLYAQQKQGKPIRLNNKLWEKILDAVEALNEGIENNARFATYRASRHVGSRTRARSAYDAKEITVNFNRKGAGSKTYGFKSQNKRVEDAAKAFGVTSQVLGEGRIFFNATVQAIATTFKNFQHEDGSLNKSYIAKWTAKYAIPPFLFGLALPMINKALASAFGGDDDDPYAYLPEWTRRTNLCFYIGNNNFITIPIGQELAAFLSLGDMAAGMTYAPELKPLDKSFDDEIVGIMNTFSPVDVDTKITKGGLMENPISEVAGRTFSVLAPLVAVENNLSWTGRPIYREDKFQNDQYTPEYQMVYSGTNPVLVNASKLLHELGGGDDVTRGKLEVNPAIVQYLWEQYTGGPGKVFSNTISIGKDAQDLLSGSETEFNIRKVEGLKAFVQQGDDRTAYYRTQAKYRKYSEDAEKLYHDVKGYENGASENPMYLLKLEEITKGDDFVRMQIIREADKQLSEINKAANKAEGKERKELRKLYNQSVKEVVDLLDSVGK